MNKQAKNVLLNFKPYDNDAKMFGGLVDDELHKQTGKYFVNYFEKLIKDDNIGKDLLYMAEK